MFMTNHEMVYGKGSDSPEQHPYDIQDCSEIIPNSTQVLAEDNITTLSEGIGLIKNGIANLSGKVKDYAKSDDAKNKLEKVKTLSGNAINNVKNLSGKAIDYARSDEAKDKLEKVKNASGNAINNVRNFSGKIMDSAKSNSKISLEKENEISEDAAYNMRLNKSKISLEKENEVSETVNPVSRASGSVMTPVLNRSSSSSERKNAPAASMNQKINAYLAAEKRQNKINSYFEGFEEDDDEYEDNDNLNDPVPVIESGDKSLRMVPILIAVIILLCLLMGLLLLNLSDLRKSSGQMVDNSNKAGEPITPVVSETQKSPDPQIGAVTEINNEKTAVTIAANTEAVRVETSPVTKVTEVVEKHEFLKSGYVHSVAKSLNIRKEPDANSDVVGEIPFDSCIELYSSQKSGWYYTKYNSKEGYINADYIAFNMYDAPRNKIEHQYDELIRRTIRLDSGSLNMRYGPSLNDDVTITIPNNTEVLLYGENGEWYYGEYVHDGTIYKGYLSKQYLPDPNAKTNTETQNNAVIEENHSDNQRVEPVETNPTELYAEEVSKDDTNCDYYYNKYSQYYFCMRFSASTDIEDFTIYVKNFDTFEEVYKHGNLEKGKSLIAGIALPGDFMTGIISFKDNVGKTRYYYVYISGENGSIKFGETDKYW